MNRILIHCPVPHGGIAEHAHYQAKALAQRGGDEAIEAVLLSAPGFLAGRHADYSKVEVYPARSPEASAALGKISRILPLVAKSWQLVADQWRLASEVWRRRPTAVLLSSYSEYLAPLWVWPHVLLSKWRGVTYVANLHDPVRDYVIGPKWWHDLSVRMAYWPISVGVVHAKLPEPSPVPSHVRVVEAPVGVYDLEESAEDPAIIRASWGVPENALVFLAFGYIRDNKNLDLVIRTLTSCPGAFLVVMGKAQSQKDKPAEYYRKLAEEVCVADRVRFYDAFVPDEKLASYFAAADIIVLTYDRTFRSQSGVLNIAARARRLVLASAGESPLKTCVEQFRLGIFVAPDDFEALAEGMRESVSRRGLIYQSMPVPADERAADFGRRSQAAGKMEEPRSVQVNIAQSPDAKNRPNVNSLCNQVENAEHNSYPDWEGYEVFASWQTNIRIILTAIHDCQVNSTA